MESIFYPEFALGILLWA